MAFFNLPILIVGSLAVAVPILLHLIMRQRPKRQVFPALRLLKKRESANSKSLRLRHLLLLALRCGAIVLLAAALARPHVSSAAIGNWAVTGGLLALTAICITATVIGIARGRGKTFAVTLGVIAVALAAATSYAAGRAISEGQNILLGDREAPVSAVIVVDTSPKMDYRHENETRIDRARRMTDWLVRRFPKDSEISIVETREGRAVFSIDLGAALRAISSLKATTASRSLPAVAVSALKLLAQAKNQRKELYIVSDLTTGSWQGTSEKALTDQLVRDSDVALYIIDVGVESPRNMAIADVRLSEETLAAGSSLDVDVRIEGTEPNKKVTATFLMEEPNRRPPVVVDGKIQGFSSTVRGQREMTLDEKGTASARFPISSLAFGVYHGVVRINSSDALPIDDNWYFTLQVREPWPILIAAGPDSVPEFLTETLAPLQFRETGRTKYDFRVVPTKDLGSQKLSEFSAVCLLDPAPLSPAMWQGLERFVSRGGGLAAFLGRNAAPVSDFNSPAAMMVLPAPIKRTWRAPEGLFLAPTDYVHPILDPFRQIASTVPWDALPVYDHWVVGDSSDGSHVVLAFGNGKPAILERALGEGRVIMMTTPISDNPNTIDRKPWNLLPVGEDSISWPFLILSDRLLRHLVDADSYPLNHTVGEVARLRVATKPAASRFQVATPALDWQDLTAQNGMIQIQFTESIGAYRVFSEDGAPVGGFSMNLAPGATKLDRIEADDLDSVLGPGRYNLAREPEELTREVDQGRVGREFYPFLMVALVVTLAIENLMSNRFYSM